MSKLALTAILFAASATRASDPVDCVDPFIGTGAHGKTFPGPATPFGLVQLSPDTITGGDNGSGYRRRDTTIQGFSFTHMSGVGWYGDLGNLLVMPTVGPLRTYYGETNKPGTGYLSPFSHDTETASAGYYAVTLADTRIRTEVTATPHAGLLRFTFPANAQSRIQLDLARRVGGTSLHQSFEVVGDHELVGQIDCTPDGGGWGHGAGKPNYTVYFSAQFDRPLTNIGAWSADLPETQSYRDALNKPWFINACMSAKILPNTRKLDGKHLGFYAEFPTKDQERINLKVGLSFASIDGARANLAKEVPAFDFDLARQQARAAWAKELTRIDVEGGTDSQRSAFYTAMYHAMLDPRTLADVNGDYPGGDGQAHHTTRFAKRSVFSGWDVYRSAFPLYTLIAPRVVNDTVNSFVELAEQNKTNYFDRWEFLNAYSGCMNGNPAIVVINDAYQKGIRDYDAEKAYRFAVNTQDKFGNGDRGYAADANYPLSKTLEYANDDWNLSKLADSLGHKEEAAKFLARSRAYRNVFDASVPWTYDDQGKDAHAEWKGWFRAKNADGTFAPWLGLTSEKTCQEASVYQQGWLVPQDIPGLIDLLGGRDLFVAKLADFFDRTPDMTKWNAFYNHPNEPVHLIPFLFNRAGAPWLTQKYVRQICQTYKPGPEGLCGDEDVGQMSAWFVLASAGLHPACPGDPRYELFTPLFDKVTLHLDTAFVKGTTFTITAKNQSPENTYIQSATLNGHPLNRCYLTHAEITAGGDLTLELGATPNKSWGLAEK